LTTQSCKFNGHGGKLNEIVTRFGNFKLITIQCESADWHPAENLARYGDVTEKTPPPSRTK